MKIFDYYNQILMPANSAVAAMQMNGMPISKERAKAQMDEWQNELLDLERYVEGEAAKCGIALKYSKAHAPQEKPLLELLYSPKGIGLAPLKQAKTRASTDDEALKKYAAIGLLHREDDNPIAYAVLKIRSIAKARATHLGGLKKWTRSDGCVHPKFKWMLPNTTRLSAEDPPVHQIPERADPEIAKKVKACIVPRVKPWLGPIEEWDPRKHGWVMKADVKGAEAVVRAGCIAKCDVSVPYLRSGGDIHSKTASILYDVPEGTYTKGSQERDTVGKQSYFLLIFGGSWIGLQRVLWKRARLWVDKEEAQRLVGAFFFGYPNLLSRYIEDTILMFKRGYVEDYYGRRWSIPPPGGVTHYWEDDDLHFNFPSDLSKEERSTLHKKLENRRHIYANRGTQTSQATTTLWCLALTHHGEYVELCAPDYWNGVVPFPEASTWALNGGNGPNGGRMQAWMMNTVHDSLWVDGAPGHLEPAAKTITRRFNGVPADFLLENNMPWRVEIEVGPDLGHLEPYNKVAKKFDLEPMPER